MPLKVAFTDCSDFVALAFQNVLLIHGSVVGVICSLLVWENLLSVWETIGTAMPDTAIEFKNVLPIQTIHFVFSNFCFSIVLGM